MKNNVFASLSFLLCITLIPGCQLNQNASIDKPNIIFVLADDLGIGDISAYNDFSKIETPNIDKLSETGALFHDANSPSSVCTPTRYMLLTGQYSWKTRLKRSVLWSWDEPLIADEIDTLPELLKAADYDTAMIGKWHLGWNWATKDGKQPAGKGMIAPHKDSGKNVDFTKNISGGPITHGFDYYFGVDVPNFPPFAWIENDKLTAIPNTIKPKGMYGANGPMVEGWSLEDIEPTLTDKVVTYIESRKSNNKPFFLYYAMTAPHTPINPVEDWTGTSKAGAYGDFVQQIDASVGKIMRALSEANLAENTILIFTADNGSAGYSNNNSKSQSSLESNFGHETSLDLKGYKLSVFEGGFRVPLIINWPGNIKPDTEVSSPIFLIDWLRTLARIADVKMPDNAAPDSFDMLPEITDAERIGPKRETSVLHSFNGSFVLRKGKLKLIAGSGPGFGKDKDAGPDQYYLYDLETDPSEKTDIAAQHPEIVEQMKATLINLKTSRSSFVED